MSAYDSSFWSPLIEAIRRSTSYTFSRPSTGSLGSILSVAMSPTQNSLSVGDPSARRYAEFATVWVECPIDSVSPLDSYASAMSLVNVLASNALAARPRESRTRIAAINGLYDELGELEV